jgi:hypothetical protein
MDQVGDIIAERGEKARRTLRIPTVSSTVRGGTLLEMVLESDQSVTAFALWRDGTWSLVPDYHLSDEQRLVPLSPQNNLVEHGVVRFAAGPEEYGSERDLARAVRSFIHRYVNLSPRFERVSAAYVLLSWISDAFNELPYLRVRGEPGTGKTRFLLTVGSLCYKPIFASGASTISPIFRILDLVRGTLILDESDFRFSDERSEVVKILNNGNVRGFPVLRTETVPGSKEFNPRAYHVFGPKLIATRGFFDDAALESRFLTEEMSSLRLRADIPISLPASHEAEALHLRNQLLLFRFRNHAKPRDLVLNVDRSLEPRLAQIFAPLLSIVEDEETLADLHELAQSYNREMAADRLLDVAAELLMVIRELWMRGEFPAVKEIAARFMERHGTEYPQMTPKRVGWFIRRKLGLETAKSNGVYVIPPTEASKLEQLYERYGIATDVVPTGSDRPQGPQRP